MEKLNKEEIKLKVSEWEKLSTEEHAHICTMIMRALGDKLQEMKDLFEQLSHTYQAEMAATGISIVCNIDSVAFDESTQVYMSGTSDGLMHNFKHLTNEIVKMSDNILRDQLKEMHDDSDEEPA